MTVARNSSRFGWKLNGRGILAGNDSKEPTVHR
jgi:hypothetical protein